MVVVVFLYQITCDSTERALLTSESDNPIYCKSSNVLERNVTRHNGNSINDSVRVLPVVTRISVQIVSA